MSDRSQAIDILKQARDALLTRLAQSVIESQEEILDDASGYSYGGQIETLHEQLGTRLTSVNSLMAHLQSADDGLHAAGDAPSDALPLELLVHAEAFDDGTLLPEPGVSTDPASFDSFLNAIERDDTRGAAHMLAELFGLDSPRAEVCAGTFRDRFLRSADFAERVRRLRFEVPVSDNRSLTLLWECFGLAVPESIEVLETLRDRLDYA